MQRIIIQLVCLLCFSSVVYGDELRLTNNKKNTGNKNEIPVFAEKDENEVKLICYGTTLEGHVVISSSEVGIIYEGNVDISDTGTTIPVMTDDDEEIRIDIYTQDQHLYGSIE